MRRPDPPPMVVALKRPGSEATSEALPFAGWTLTLLSVIWAGISKTSGGLKDGEREGYEGEQEATKRVEKTLGYGINVTPQSRAECTVSLKNQMSVKLTVEG